MLTSVSAASKRLYSSASCLARSPRLASPDLMFWVVKMVQTVSGSFFGSLRRAIFFSSRTSCASFTSGATSFLAFLTFFGLGLAAAFFFFGAAFFVAAFFVADLVVFFTGFSAPSSALFTGRRAQCVVVKVRAGMREAFGAARQRVLLGAARMTRRWTATRPMAVNMVGEAGFEWEEL